MSNYSVDRERIKVLCKINGINYSPKTIKNIKGFLDTFGRIRGELAYIPKGVFAESLRTEAPEIFKAMLQDKKINNHDLEETLTALVRSGKFEEILEVALTGVVEFSPEGETYRKILDLLYFNNNQMRNKEVEAEIGYCHTTYQEKKEYAIMLFGVLFWRELLKYWDNSTEEMYSIEKSLGRDGSLSKGKFEEERKR